MSNRKYASRFEKLKRKRRLESLIESQKGAVEKFLTYTKDETKESEETLIKKKT